MPYYGDGLPYYYGSPYANHSSLMTGTTRIHTPLSRFSPHLSTITESPLGIHRYSPVSVASRPRRVIDTADIDVSTPRILSGETGRQRNRLRRDRPTIKIRSQALKDNPALREHNERHEKSVGELLMEKFLIKDKKPDNDDGTTRRLKLFHQVSLDREPLEPDVVDEEEEVPQSHGKITRRFTRRRSSADIQLDPEQLQREVAYAQVQAEVLDSLVAAEQAEIENEVRRGTLIRKGTTVPVGFYNGSYESPQGDEKPVETEPRIRKTLKKVKKKRKQTEKPPDEKTRTTENNSSETDFKSSAESNVEEDEEEGKKIYKIEASNSVGDFSTIWVNAGEPARMTIEQFRESVRIPVPRKLMERKCQDTETEVVLPVRKPYVKDESRNSVYFTVKTPTELKGPKQFTRVAKDSVVNGFEDTSRIDGTSSKEDPGGKRIDNLAGNGAFARITTEQKDIQKRTNNKPEAVKSLKDLSRVKLDEQASRSNGAEVHPVSKDRSGAKVESEDPINGKGRKEDGKDRSLESSAIAEDSQSDCCRLPGPSKINTNENNAVEAPELSRVTYPADRSKTEDDGEDRRVESRVSSLAKGPEKPVTLIQGQDQDCSRTEQQVPDEDRGVQGTKETTTLPGKVKIEPRRPEEKRKPVSSKRVSSEPAVSGDEDPVGRLAKVKEAGAKGQTFTVENHVTGGRQDRSKTPIGDRKSESGQAELVPETTEPTESTNKEEVQEPKSEGKPKNDPVRKPARTEDTKDLRPIKPANLEAVNLETPSKVLQLKQEGGQSEKGKESASLPGSPKTVTGPESKFPWKTKPKTAEPKPSEAKPAEPKVESKIPGNNFKVLNKSVSVDSQRTASPLKPLKQSLSADEVPKTPTTKVPEPKTSTTKVPEPKTPITKVPEPKTPTTKVPEPKTPITKVPEPKSPVTKPTEPNTPATKVPEPKSPVTKVPEPKSPVTKVADPKSPVTKVPDPKSPVTKVPDPKSPLTKVPEPKSPVTKVPEPKSHVTKVPEPKTPVTKVPEPKSPVTKVPEPKAPVTKLPEAKTSVTKVPEGKTPVRVEEPPKKIVENGESAAEEAGALSKSASTESIDFWSVISPESPNVSRARVPFGYGVQRPVDEEVEEEERARDGFVGEAALKEPEKKKETDLKISLVAGSPVSDIPVTEGKRKPTDQEEEEEEVVKPKTESSSGGAEKGPRKEPKRKKNLQITIARQKQQREQQGDDSSGSTLTPNSLANTPDTSVPASEVSTPVAEISLPLINIVAAKAETPQTKDEEEDPTTPTNESPRSITKWDNRDDLSKDGKTESASSTRANSLAATPSGTPSGTPGGTPESSKKKRIVKKKKPSTTKKSPTDPTKGSEKEGKDSRKGSKESKKDSTRKLDSKKDSARKLDSKKDSCKSQADKSSLKPPENKFSPRTSPRNSPQQRPLDLIRMFYTTPSALLTATPRDLSKVRRAKVKRRKHQSRTPSVSSDSTGSTTSTATTGSTGSTSTELDDDTEHKRMNSTRSNDSGFDGSPRISNCDMACHKKCEKLTGNLCGLNQKLVAEALQALKRAPSQSSDNQRNSDSSDHFASGRITPPATNLPRFKKYAVSDFNFLKVLGKGSFGKVLLAELRGTECVYAVKCLKKDVVLEDDDVECTLIERKVLTLATRHPYLCHLFCTFQTESHLFFVMEYLNGGDLMFHIQKSGRFPETRAQFYAAEIWSGLNFLHKKGIVYRDLKLDNVLLDFDGHIRIADFGMCKLQIFLDRTADTFCGTPDYMAPEIIKGLKYNQAVDWWSYGVLLYEMLTGQSPFSGCDEDELFWSICNERPFIPRYLSQEATDILVCLLEKDSGKRLPGHDIAMHPFFQTLPWDRLERRQLEPPFKPALDHTLDTKYFDTAFTAERPRLTPVPEQILTSMDQGVFRGFSYTNPNATD